jgi:PAS domain S-box-containing protein
MTVLNIDGGGKSVIFVIRSDSHVVHGGALPLHSAFPVFGSSTLSEGCAGFGFDNLGRSGERQSPDRGAPAAHGAGEGVLLGTGRGECFGRVPRFTPMTVPQLELAGPEPHGMERRSGELPGFSHGRSLVTKLTLLVGLTLAALIALLLAAGFYFGREVLRKQIDAHLSSVASSRQDTVMAHLSQLKQRVELLADHGEFRAFFHHLKTGQPDAGNRPYSQSRLNDLADHRTILSASLADSTGRVLLADKGTETGGELAGDPAFVNGLAGPYVGLPQMVGDHFEVVLSAPIRSFDSSPRNIAVLLMTADISPLAAAVRDTTGLGQTGEVVLFIREGENARTLFPPRHREQNMAIPLVNVPAMAAALTGRVFLGATRDYRGERVLAAALPVGYGGWGLETKMDTREAYAPIARALRYILLCGAIVAAAGLLAAYLLARSIARPVQRLVQAASRVAGGDYDAPAPIESADEFGVLSARFNEMTAAIRSRAAERDAKETALQESELRLKAIGDHLPGSTIYEFGIRPNGSHFFVYLSAGIERSTSYRAEELLAHPEKVYENVVEEDLATMMRATHESAQNLSVLDQQVRRRMPSGEIRWFHSRSMPRLLDDGSTVWDGVELDVTDYKRAEEALRASEERLQQVMDLVPHFVFAKDTDGRFLFANRALAQIFGMAPEELVGRRDSDLSPDEKEAAHFLSDDREVIASGRLKFISEERHTDPNGRTRILQTTKVQFALPRVEKPGVLGVSVDITELKQAEEERQRVETKLQDMQKLESLGVLAGGIAHDFNNLLTGVLGNASLARMDLPEASPVVPYLDQIEKAAQHAADLCRQMLAYAGKGRFVLQDVDLSALVRETTHLLESSIAKGVVLQFNLADNLPAVSADATQLRQIVMNLVINASEAIGARSGNVQVSTGLVRVDRAYLDETVLAPELPEGDYVHLEVTDNGSGMTPDTLAKIFDPFFTTKFTGRGLGLAAVLGIVRGHKGALKVYSERGKGTSFRILLPGAGAPAIAPVVVESATDHWRGSGTVLVVDDEEMVRMTAVRMLQSLGFTVLTANNGREGVECFRAAGAEIRAVLLDLTMPHLDGEGAFRELRLLRPEARVLLMSGFSEQEAIHRFIGKGLAGFLQKPFRLESLRARLKEILA